MTKKALQYQDGKSDKFWTISLSGCRHTVIYGRTGTNGQTQTKDFPTVEAALKSYEKLVAEKLKKGDVEIEQQSSNIIASNAIASSQKTQPPLEQNTTATLQDIPANWRSLALAEIQAQLTQNKKQLCELAAIDAIPAIYLFDLELNIRIEIAKSPATHSNLLTLLVNDERVEVRKGLANNPNLPVELMNKLAKDSTLEIRIALSKNINAHNAALAVLADDPYQKVRKNVALHKNTPGDTIIEKSLKELLSYDRKKAEERAARSLQSSPSTMHHSIALPPQNSYLRASWNYPNRNGLNLPLGSAMPCHQQSLAIALSTPNKA